MRGLAGLDRVRENSEKTGNKERYTFYSGLRLAASIKLEINFCDPAIFEHNGQALS